tara:strand:- start:242 stop:547 length:306 start_codon:yes stop_codon:yes gene_type:complete
MPAQFNINEITKDNPNRWFYVMNSEGEEGLVVFGYAGDQGVTEVVTGQPTINAFLTESELEDFVNEDVGMDSYYKDSVESDSDKFQGPSVKYPYEPPEMEE